MASGIRERHPPHDPKRRFRRIVERRLRRGSRLARRVAAFPVREHGVERLRRRKTAGHPRPTPAVGLGGEERPITDGPLHLGEPASWRRVTPGSPGARATGMEQLDDVGYPEA